MRGKKAKVDRAKQEREELDFVRAHSEVHKEEAERQKVPPEIMGVDHPKMTPELVAQLLPQGPHIPTGVLEMVGRMCNPLEYRGIPKETLVALFDHLKGQLDRQLREAQILKSS